MKVSSSYNINFLYSIKTSGKALKFDSAEINKKREFMLLSKQLI